MDTSTASDSILINRMHVQLHIDSETYLKPNVLNVPKVLASADGNLWF
jgi:hypothetical protein